MTDDWPVKAYRNRAFIDRIDARPLRILAEYLEPQARFEDLNIADTIVFFGSARILSNQEATRALEEARASDGGVDGAEKRLALSRYYEDARELARRLTEWSKGLEDTRRRFVVLHWRRPRHHGGRQPGRLGSQGDQHRTQHLPARRTV